MGKANHKVESAIIIIIFTLISKILGFLREVLIAAKFGSGIETDTFFIAIAATSLLTGFLTNAIGTTFIPVLSEIEAKEGKKGKIEHMNNVGNVIFVISIFLVLIGVIFTPFIIKIIAKGFEGDQFALAVKLTRIGFPMILFSGITGVFTAYLHSENRFTSPAASGVPLNISYIIFLLFLSPIFGIKGLMVSVVIGVAFQFLIQLPEAKIAGYKYELRFDLKDQYIKKVLLLSVPVLIGVAIDDLNGIVDKSLASNLVSGSISALNYASKLNGLILSVFISAIVKVIFPMLSKKSNDNDIVGLKKMMGRGMDLLLIITVPATVGLIVLSTPIIQIAFQRGEFDILATSMTSIALKFYAIGLVAMAVKLLLTRVYYSLQDTKTPMINAGIAVAFNIGLNLILVRYMAHAGLAFATSISTIITSLLLFYGLKKKIGALGTKGYLVTFFKIGVASIIMGGVSYFIYYSLYRILGISKINNLLSLLSAILIGAIIYGVLCYLFKVREVRNLVDSISEKINFRAK